MSSLYFSKYLKFFKYYNQFTQLFIWWDMSGKDIDPNKIYFFSFDLPLTTLLVAVEVL